MSHSDNPSNNCQPVNSFSPLESGAVPTPARPPAPAPFPEQPFPPFQKPATSNSRFRVSFVSIDKISFVAKLHIPFDTLANERTCPTWEQFLNHPDFKGRRYAQYPYQYSLDTFSRTIFQLSYEKANVPDLRCEFNPNSKSGGEGIIKTLLPLLSDIRITRIDYAIDYNLDLSEWQFEHTPSVKTCTYRAANKQLETLYFGSRNSERQIRIYDKAKEAKLSDTLWRIEAQCRIPPDIDFRTIQPFAGLSVFKTFEGLSFSERAAIRELRLNPLGWSELSRPYARRIKKLMEACDNTIHLEPNPHDLYLAQSGEVHFQLSNLFGDKLK